MADVARRCRSFQTTIEIADSRNADFGAAADARIAIPAVYFFELATRASTCCNRAHRGRQADRHQHSRHATRSHFRLPRCAEQRAIAHILGTLDDKIELNRRMNETLEAMARALFKSWFVDFDPVRAKAEGRDPGLPQPLADLFPDSFEDSELGEIPRGWSATPLYGIATYINGAAFAAFQPNTKTRLPIIKIAEAEGRRYLRRPNSQMSRCPRSTELQKATSSSRGLGIQILRSIRLLVWRVRLAQSAYLSSSCHCIRMSARLCSATLKTMRPVFAEIARNKQTTGLGHVLPEDMKRLLVARPDDRVMLRMEQTSLAAS